MDLYNRAFQEALSQNEVAEEKWKTFKNEVVQTRDTINTFLKSYKLDIMVPLGKKAFIRGRLQHTNDILVSHSSSYFSAVSNMQANEIMEHRTSKCNERLTSLQKERDLYRGNIEASKSDMFGENEIIEEYNEEAEKEWREKHRESVKRQKIKESEERQKNAETNIENLLDQYELLEEMSNELDNLDIDSNNSSEMIEKLISGKVPVPKPKERIAHEEIIIKPKIKEESPVKVKISHNSEKKDKSEEKSDSNVKEKRSVRFSSSLEDIKIFDTKIEENQAKAENNTINISFKHSPAKLIEAIETDPAEIVKHPGDIIVKYKQENSVKTKSILKETNYDPRMNYKIDTSRHEIKEVDLPPISSFPLICNDEVVEKKPNTEKCTLLDFETKSMKRISKFKEMRLKMGKASDEHIGNKNLHMIDTRGDLFLYKIDSSKN